MLRKVVLPICGFMMFSSLAMSADSMESRVLKLEQSLQEQKAKELELTSIVKNLQEKQTKESKLANILNDFEFHGYARSGFIADVNNGGKAGGNFNINQVGRLGNENNTYAEMELIKKITADSGMWVKFHVMFNAYNEAYESNGNIGFNQVWAEMGGGSAFGGGAFKDSSIWAGKRFYVRRDVHHLDWYYTNYTGTGIGVDNVSVGNGKLNFGVITNGTSNSTNVVTSNGVTTTTNEPLIGFLANYNIGKYELDVVVNNTTEAKSGTAEFGVQGTLQYNADKFYGFAKGMSKVFIQGGFGVSAGNGLGNMNGAETTKDAGSVRLGTWGLANLGDKWDLATAVYAQFDNEVSTTVHNNTTVSVSARPVYKVNDIFELQFEGGYAFIDQNVRGGTTGDSATNMYKLTFAPTFKMNTKEFWVRPEFRTFVSYTGYDNDTFTPAENTTAGDKGVNLGAQMEIWF